MIERTLLQRSFSTSSSETLGRITKGALVAAASFVMLGTVSALWSNPLFVRMVPAGNWEVGALLLLPLLAGLFVAVRRPLCSVRSAGVGGVVGFLGIACPVCNKVLMLAFGSELLLAYFEPIRPWVAGVGVLVLAAATVREVILARRPEASLRQIEAPAKNQT